MSELVTQTEAKRLWIRAQKLNVHAPFGHGPAATQAAVEHLGYVQIDTIHVIERCHHHILYNRIPSYRRQDLHQAQALDKSVFEFWTHALSYVPTRDFRYFMRDMKEARASPGSWYRSVTKEELQIILRRVRREGALSIRDIKDDVLVEKDHEWASRKPSKRALQLAFHAGLLVISERVGMLKKYELTERHFDWDKKPRAATKHEVTEYLLERALRTQGLVSLDSISHLEPKKKPVFLKLIEGVEKIQHWMKPELLEFRDAEPTGLVHLLSPFDPLIIQRRRLDLFFGYPHRFEAYLPKEKRQFGYFALPVLMDDQIVATLDLKTDRALRKLRIQKWTWIGKNQSLERKKRIEGELSRFEKFQLER